MISAWHGYYPSQQQIAETVGVDPDDGADETQMRDGYYRKSRSSNGLGKGGSYVLAGSPSNLYDLVKTEIDRNRPVAINTPAHARACAGYSRNVESGNRYFYIYNPWPVGSGDLTWEMWNGLSSGYDSSIFVID